MILTLIPLHHLSAWAVSGFPCVPLLHHTRSTHVTSPIDPSWFSLWDISKVASFYTPAAAWSPAEYAVESACPSHALTLLLLVMATID